MLEGLPLQVAGAVDARASFLTWQRQMRGALSHLPMASGPWIWKPPAETQEPIQHDLFGGL